MKINHVLKKGKIAFFKLALIVIVLTIFTTTLLSQTIYADNVVSCFLNLKQKNQTALIKDTAAVPKVYFSEPDINGLNSNIPNGAKLASDCSDTGYPNWVYELDETSINVSDFCSADVKIFFSLNTEYPSTYNKVEYIEKFSPTWTVNDTCGNEAIFSFEVEVIDNTPPEFYSSDVLYLCESQQVGWAIAFDACSKEYVRAIDEPIPGCGSAFINRIYYVQDDCENLEIYEQTVIDLSQNPDLITLDSNFNINSRVYDCDFPAKKYIKMDVNSVKPITECLTDLEIKFSEKLIPKSFENDKVMVQLLWTATTPCGYTDSLEYLIDQDFPSFSSFKH